MSQASRLKRVSWMAGAMAVFGGFAWLALATRLNHDESQYLAGAVLASHRLPFRDFLVLQPPLALWVWAPFAAAAGAWSLVALRLTSALFTTVMLVAVFDTARRLARPLPAALATLLMASCGTVLFTAAVARNDALPAMLLAIGMNAFVRSTPGRPHWITVSGLMLGLAAAAKLSSLPPLLALALHLAWRPQSRRLLPGLALGAGLGLAPFVLSALAAPDAWFYGVWRFPVVAPRLWYAAAGQAGTLTLAGKLHDLVEAALAGPALIALALVIGARRLTSGDPHPAGVTALLAGGIVGAALPTPTHPAYLLPALPPLFALLARALDGHALRHVGWIALFVTSTSALRPAAHDLRRGFAAVKAVRDAAALGELLRRGGVRTPVATLNYERIAGAGLPPDPRFATGPFVFRSGETLSRAQAMRFGVATPRTLAAMFSTEPPGAVLVGYEPGWRPGDPAVDAPLERWAVGHGYHAVASPDGRGRLYLAPTALRPADTPR